jgi:hypothetical protein
MLRDAIPFLPEAVMLKRLVSPALLVVAVVALLLAPSQSVIASDCGLSGPDVCGETETCRGWLWWKKCTTSNTKYWNSL